MRRLMVAGVALVWSAVAAGAQSGRVDYEARAPLPVVVEVTPVTTAVPSALAAFHGAWAGAWGDDWRHLLVVTKIEADGKAEVIYSVADFAPFEVYGQWGRHSAEIKDGMLHLVMGRNKVSYRLDADGALEAMYFGGNGRHTPGYLVRHAGPLAGPHLTLGDVPLEGRRVAIPHPGLAKRADGASGMLEGRYYKPTGTAAAPLAILNHGSGVGRGLNVSYATAGHARWLRAKGYAVLVPMRRGRGVSDGVVAEDVYVHAPNGQITNIDSGVSDALADLEASIAYGRTLPGVKAGPVLLLGQSRGGFLSVVYAGLKPGDVSGVINFVGGWLGGSPSVEKLNTPYFAAGGKGAGAAVPQLWIYGDKDSFYGEAHVRANHQAFETAGGKAQFEFYTTVPGNGHYVGGFPDLWRGAADAFLDKVQAAK